MSLLDGDEGQEAEVEEDVEPQDPGHREDEADVGVGQVTSLRGLPAKTAPHASRLCVIVHDNLVHSLDQPPVPDLDVDVDLSIGKGLEDVLESGKYSSLWHHRFITVVFSWTEVDVECVFDSRHLAEVQVPDVPVDSSQSEEMLVMRHHDLAILGQVDIELQHPGTQPHGVMIGLQCVLIPLRRASCNILTNQRTVMMSHDLSQPIRVQ